MIYKLKSGREIEVDKEALMNDFLFVRAITRIMSVAESGDEEKALSPFFECWARVFANEKNEEAYYKELAKEHGGRVPQNIVMEDFLDLLEQLGEAGKNSESSVNF